MLNLGLGEFMISESILRILREKSVKLDKIICFLSSFLYLAIGIYCAFYSVLAAAVSSMAMSLLIVLYWVLQVLFFGRGGSAVVFNCMAIIGMDVYFYLNVIKGVL